MKRPDWLKLSPPLVLGLVAVGVLGLGGVVIYLPQRQTASLRKGVEDYRSSLPKPDPEKLATLENSRINTENAIRTGLIQGVGGTVLLIGLYFTYQNLRATQRNVEIAEAKQVTDRKTAEANLKLAEAKQVTDRFSTAVGMLSHVSMHTRLGGIYALERIARDSDDDYWQVMEVLTAFVREESPWPPKTEKTESEGASTEAKGTDQTDQIEAPQSVAEQSAAVEASQSAALQPELSDREQRLKELREHLVKLPPLRTDIQAVMTVIGRRQHRFNEGETQRLDLSKTDLRKLQAERANLTGVDLSGAHLEHANLSGAHLEDAYLLEAHLENADLREAHLEGADLIEAHLEGANLLEAHLENAILLEAHLENANLWRAHLEGANLSGAHLEDAFLREAHLEDAYLLEAHLENADLREAHLEQADLSGADLSQVPDLTQAQLDSAITDEHTKLPDYLLVTQPTPQAPIAPLSMATPEPTSEPQPPAR